MKTAHQKRLDFRARLKSKKIMIVPGIYDALSAKIAQEAGIPCLAMGGYAIEASRLAQPDVGLLSLSEMTTALKQICDAVDIPVIGDGDTGYGNALNAIRTEQEFEAAGAACVFLEDQVWPKRCGHMDGKQVITAEEHAQKLRAAVDARVDKEMMIMARTDTRAINGLDDAIERGKRYADAGAEILFIEALRDRAEIEKAARAFEGTGIYLTSNMIEGGKTPLIPASELEQMGYSVVFWACSSLYLVSKTLHDAFTVLNTTGTTASIADKMIDFPRFNHFIGLDTYKKLEREYKVDRDD
jgi:2-methylisocitrate lyase-like PEP mutase family enzyme